MSTTSFRLMGQMTAPSAHLSLRATSRTTRCLNSDPLMSASNLVTGLAGSLAGSGSAGGAGGASSASAAALTASSAGTGGRSSSTGGCSSSGAGAISGGASTGGFFLARAFRLHRFGLSSTIAATSFSGWFAFSV